MTTVRDLGGRVGLHLVIGVRMTDSDNMQLNLRQLWCKILYTMFSIPKDNQCIITTGDIMQVGGKKRCFHMW